MDIIIKNVKRPLLIQNTLQWDLLNWDINKWKHLLSDEILSFRCGKNCYTNEPQFENTTTTQEMTFEEFLKVQTDSQWYYFDYKYLKDWFINHEALRKEISWADFGFPELNVEDSTIWIGSKGAHTTCHTDSYGCNIIAQIYGRKRWMLFPPEEDLQPTRIPYEESSTFSKVNLFAPQLSSLTGVKNCFSVVLNPGDVLVVPHKWWHYVENLEIAISINTWIKLPVDYEERVKEALVRLSIVQYLKELHPDEQNSMLTTNVEPDMLDESPFETSQIILNCLKAVEEHQTSSAKLMDIPKILKKFPNIQELEALSENERNDLFMSQRKRFAEETKTGEEPTQIFDDTLRDLKKIIDATVHGDVVQLIYDKLMQQK